MKKLNAYSLILEITRQCNMNCKHCLRGEPENLQISNKIINATLEGIQDISSLTFSGGEPCLNIEAMKYTLQACKLRDIPVRSFYIVTNGKQVTDEFLTILKDWYVYTLECSYLNEEELSPEKVQTYNHWIDEEILSGVALSSDKFHDPIPLKNLFKLKSLSFFTPDKFTDFDKVSLINMGRAERLEGYKKVDLSEEDMNQIEFFSEEDVETLYINAKGDILGACDLSYEKQETHKLGNVLDTDWTDKLRRENN